ncbi:aspartate aminotransferase family protein [Litorimonas sp. RW-G-Af-16]|uniref:aspartate aminotransferase family protein n=1 Tax=Litorimonas sp. RW-G-Af-16 TaxID=3241168 RepID=UPI00390C959E
MAKGDHLFDCYTPPALTFDRGEGPYLYTAEGKRYLDFIAGISVNAFGHAHPGMIEAITEQAGKIWHLSNLFRIPGQHELAQRYCEAAEFADKVFFTNSGAEAIECAMKTARRYHYAQGNPEKIDIITFQGAFHGRTTAAINATGNPKYLEGFGPALPGYIHLPFGDHEALKAAMGPTTAAVMVEPVQGEGGLRALPEVCLRGLRELCDEHGALLIYDEVQCGAGRTGKMFAYQWAENAEPDIIAAAKGIGGGFPLGACLASKEAASGMVPGTHGTTYGGNPLAMAAGIKAYDLITEAGFLENVTDVSNFIKQQFEALKDEFPDVVADVRGKGLLVGMRLKKKNVDVRLSLMDHGLLVGTAGENTLRLAPPLIITEDHVREAIGKLRQVFTLARDWDDV